MDKICKVVLEGLALLTLPWLSICSLVSCPVANNYYLQTGKLIMVEKESFVRLNVGGKIFLTNSNTLKTEPGSKLANIADSDGIKDESGAFYIDSCPDLFGIILNWCRFKVMAHFSSFSHFH